MSSSPDAWIKSARYRLEAARSLHADGCYADAVTRLYFAVFHSMKAVLDSRGFTARTHKGAHMLLGRHFRDTLDTQFAHRLWDDREDCDYRLHEPSQAQVEEALDQTEHFVAATQALL